MGRSRRCRCKWRCEPKVGKWGKRSSCSDTSTGTISSDAYVHCNLWNALLARQKAPNSATPNGTGKCSTPASRNIALWKDCTMKRPLITSTGRGSSSGNRKYKPCSKSSRPSSAATPDPPPGPKPTGQLEETCLPASSPEVLKVGTTVLWNS